MWEKPIGTSTDRNEIQSLINKRTPPPLESRSRLTTLKPKGQNIESGQPCFSQRWKRLLWKRLSCCGILLSSRRAFGQPASVRLFRLQTSEIMIEIHSPDFRVLWGAKESGWWNYILNGLYILQCNAELGIGIFFIYAQSSDCDHSRLYSQIVSAEISKQINVLDIWARW